MFKNQRGNIFLGLLIIALWVAAGVGYVINIVKIVGLWHAPIASEIVIRAIGVFAAPLGAIAGYF